MNPIDLIVKNFPILLIAWAGWSAFEYNEVKVIELEDQKNVTDSLAGQFARVERELNEVKRFEENLEESKKRVESVQAKLETIQKQLPAVISDTEVNQGLTTIADSLKMLNPSPLPKQEVSHNFYFSKEFNFDVEGTFLQGLIFFENLERRAEEGKGRILNVKYVRFSESQTGDKRSRFKILKLSTVVEAFRYNPNYNPN